MNYLALLNADQTYQQALMTLSEARANRHADTAALFEALGGGRWNRSDITNEVDVWGFKPATAVRPHEQIGLC